MSDEAILQELGKRITQGRIELQLIQDTLRLNGL